MKTSVIMIRKMGNFDVSQRTVDGMFDANALLNQWNSAVDNPERRMSRFLESPKTIEFINEIEDNKPNDTNALGSLSALYIKKGRNTAKGRTQNEVWMHPYLFIDFALWINPKFKLQVIKFVYDELIKQRNDAGDNYISLSTSGMKLKGYNFREVATAMQWIVFNKVGKNLRQSATQEELKEMSELEKQLAYLIDNDYITSYNQLLSDMRKMYNKKYRKF